MKHKIPQLPIPGWAVVIFMAIYTESILHISTNAPILPGRLGAVLLLALAVGSGSGFLVSLLPVRSGKWAAVILGFWFGALCLLQYFIHDAYQVFMSMTSVLATGEGVAEGYTDLIVSLLIRSWWKLALVLLPVIGYGIFCKNRPSGKKARLTLAIVSVLGLAAGILTVNTAKLDTAVLGGGYNFDAAVRGFGANAAVLLDTVKESDKTGSSDDFVIETLPVTLSEPTVSPETAPEAETEATEPPVVHEPQVFPLDFAALAEAENRDYIASIHAYAASRTPSMENEFTGLFAGKNLILITAEAFSSRVIDPVLSPTLYRMATEGIHFTDYYHPVWGCGTTGGEFAHLVGMIPYGSTLTMMESVQQNLFFTMGNRLQEAGYFSAAYHNNDHTYYSRDYTHTNLGYDTWYAYGNGMEEFITNVWPRSDQEMFDHTVPLYIDHQPFSVYYMTVSGHSAYSPSNAMAQKNYHLVEDLPISEALKCYLACSLELENALRSLMEQLEAAGIADDTVVVITTDHYPYGLAKSDTWGGDGNYLAELYGTSQITDHIRDKNSLIIWSGCLEDMDIVVDEPVSVLDVLPTLSNLFNVDFDSRLMVGRDVFSDAPALVFWPLTYSWKTEKGSYDGKTGIFTPVEGVRIPEGYEDKIHTDIRNRMVFCRSAQQNDYFNVISDLMEFEK